MKGRERREQGKEDSSDRFFGWHGAQYANSPFLWKEGGSEGERRDISKEAERKNQTGICNGIKDLQFHLGNRHKGALFLRDSESHIQD